MGQEIKTKKKIKSRIKRRYIVHPNKKNTNQFDRKKIRAFFRVTSSFVTRNILLLHHIPSELKKQNKEYLPRNFYYVGPFLENENHRELIIKRKKSLKNQEFDPDHQKKQQKNKTTQKLTLIHTHTL